MNEQSLRFRIGVFVLAMMLLLGVLIVLFATFPGYFRGHKLYTVRFNDAPGVDKNTPVRRSGLRIGQVKSITLDDDNGDVKVVLEIDSQYTIRENEDATVAIGFLSSDTSIDFVPDLDEPEDPAKKRKRTPIPAGAELVGKRRVNLLAHAERVVPTTQEALGAMRDSLKRIETLIPVLEATVKDVSEIAKATKPIVNEVRDTNKEIQGLVKDVRAVVPELAKTNNAVQALAKDVSGFIPELGKTNVVVQELGKDVRAFIPELGKTNTSIRKFTDDLTTLVPELGKTNTIVQDFAKDLKGMVPELGKTNTAVQELVKATRDTIPELKKTNDEFQITARNFGKVGERLDVFIATNQEKMAEIIDSTNKTFKRVSDVFNEENQKNLSAMLKNVKNSTDHIESLSKTTEEVIRDSKKLMGKIHDSMSKADDVLGNLQKTTKPLAERSESIVRNLEETTMKLNRGLGEVENLMREFSRADGTLKLFLTDPSLYRDLDRVVCGVAKMLPKVEPMLKNLEIFTDKLARHPESIGLGGVVRPSSGLKDVGPILPPPPAPYCVQPPGLGAPIVGSAMKK